MKTKIKKSVVKKSSGLKQKTDKKSVLKKSLDKIEAKILLAVSKTKKPEYYHHEKSSAGYMFVDYFMKHKPIISKVYKASDVLKGYDRKIPFIRRNVQKLGGLVFGLKIVAVKTLCNIDKTAKDSTKNKQKFVEFKFVK